MTAFVGGRAPLLRAALGGIAVALAAALSVPALAADPLNQTTVSDPVTVHLDQAKLLKLPERTATLVVGNPLIADAVVQPGGIVVITAKSYGTTNLVAVDRAGVTLGEYPIQVVGPNETVVVLYRGVERETYSCIVNCERRITIGDSVPYFAANLNSLGAYSAQAAPDKK